ncbi:Retrovirus-related Pol polyprotein from transposon RE2 [Vitis vinifera]|uniref:Retrovirus-related Pol polyprotein from transposon RE2 n=1 Tax=Vitis vinifera TaxID=29760 RepID=A0A438DTU5_VITVI|nr:Retrovirus-related Pol polyprotein from transposon RE2 [Vitis vinifera]
MRQFTPLVVLVLLMIKNPKDVFSFGNPGAVNIIPDNIVPMSAPMGKGMRDKFPSVLLRDFVTHTVVAESPSPATPSPQHPSAIISSNDPKSFKEAMKDVGWQKSMHEEIRALEENGTWTLEPLPKGKRALGSQWVYRTKYFSNGDIERLKSRLVVLGNHQEVGIDYHETFSPVAKMTTVRAFLAIAASKNWELHQMDIHNAFLHGDLEEEVYMKLPLGFESSDPNLGNVQINVLVYVDDLIISGNDSAALKTFKAYLSDCFKMKDLGVLKHFLGIEVARSSAGLFLCQRKYTLDIVSEAGLLGAKPCGFPIEQNHRLGLENGELLSNLESYRRLVGRLIYLAVTHPDLAYSVHILSQFMQEPRIEHWEAALRVVRYLKGTPGQGILLRADSDLSLQGWCDSDWAACPVTRRSLSGWLVFLGQSPISWKTKKQHTVSRSSTEAEYRAMAAVTCELKWLKGLLLSLGVHHPKAIKLFCDSQSALHMAKNPVFHERTKHIEVDCHFVRDAITDGLIAPSYVPTVTQLADIFTRLLERNNLIIFLPSWAFLNLMLQLEGGC